MKVLFAFFFITSCLTQNELNDMDIQGIKEFYIINETLKIILTNKSNKFLFYYVSIECYMNKEWREVVNDINNPKSKASILSNFQVNEKKVLSVQLETILKDMIPSFDTYRLKINYGNSVDSISKILYSISFNIEK